MTKKVSKGNFINKLIHKSRYIHNHLKTYELGLYGETPYSMLQSWLLDVVQYGSIMYLAMLAFGLVKPIYWVAGLGISYWFILHWIKQVKKAIN